MISVLGVGGAGGNIADVASKMGYPTGAINFSQKDLDALDNVKAKLQLIGSEGVGHNRDEAIGLMQNNWESAIQFVKENFSQPSIEVIIVAFSTGGGSGSGISPILIDLLSSTMSDKTFVAMPIIPDKSEVVINQINCSRTFEELSDLDIAVFPIDNEKANSSNGKNRMFETVNNSVIGLMDKLLSYTNKHSKNGNLDKKDLLTILGTKGIGVISEVDLAKISEGNPLNISEEGFTEAIQNSWEDSVFAPLEYEQVVRSGIVFDGQESLMEYLQYENIFSKFHNGMPLDLFEGNYHEESGKIISILTGLPLCNKRLEEIHEIVESKQSNVEKVLTNSANQQYKSKIGNFSTQIRQKPKKNKSVSDILSKYQR